MMHKEGGSGAFQHAVTRWRGFGRNALYFFLTGLLVAVPALMNQSPLVYTDSGAFIGRIWSLEAMTDRPIGYPLIMRAVTWQVSLWPVVFFQGMMSSWLIFEVLRQVFPRAKAIWRIHMVLLAVLVLTSSLPWYAAQIMPDALTALIALVLFLLFFGKGIAPLKLGFLWIWLFFLGISHLSHLAILMAITGCLLIARGSLAGRSFLGQLSWWKWSGSLALIVASVLFIQGHNARWGYGRVLAPSTDLFYAAKLCESGVMYEHLKRCCPTHHHPLCEHMDQLNTTAMFFIWNKDSPMKPVGLEQVTASKLIAPLTHEVLHDVRNWPLIAWTTFTATLAQLGQVEIGSGLQPYREDSSPYFHYKWHLPHELPFYMSSAQQRGALHFEMVNHVSHLALLLSILILALYWKGSSLQLQRFVVVALAVVFFNAMVTGGVANVYDRLQARVTWLIIISATLMILYRYKDRWIAGEDSAHEAEPS